MNPGNTNDDQRPEDREVPATKSFDGLIDEPTHLKSSGKGSSTRSQANRIGEVIGGYKLRQFLGEGGFGEVYAARHEKANRIVAIKLIRHDKVTSKALKRFEVETEAMKRLGHPNVAKIFQGGKTDAGEPYLIMEFVEGVPLIEYCDNRRHSIDERLALFLQVCEGVQHIHSNGLIHRDLSPDNILVTEEKGEDGKTYPVPKIIDLGVVGAIDDDVSFAKSLSLSIDLGRLVGKFAYMSPEMAEGAKIRPDIRTDIFSLGVILYELITGIQPLSQETLKNLALHTLVENVARIERPSPSTVYGLLDAATAKKIRLARNIPTEKELARYLNGRLRHLPMTALRLDRNKRYTTVATFANDIENYLHDRDYDQAAQEPRRDRVVRNLRRHKVLYAAAATVMCALTLGIIGTTIGMNQARNAEAVAEARSNEALEAREEAQDSEKKAVLALTKANEETQRARRSEYANRIALAASEIERVNITRARRLLDDCPIDLRNYEWHRLRTLMDVSSSTLLGHESSVTSVAFRPDGKRIVSGSFDDTIKVWDAEKGSEALLTLRGHEDDVNSVAFSPDGRRIVSGSSDKTIKVWDAEKAGEALLTLHGHESSVRSVAFSPDGKRIVSGSLDNTIKVWDAEKGGQALLTMRGHESYVTSAAFSPDGRRIVSGSSDKTIKVWDAEKGGEANLTLHGHAHVVTSAAFSPDGKHIVSGSSDKTIKVWDAEKGGEALLTMRGHEDLVQSVGFSADGRRIVSGSRDKTIKVWDAEKGGQALLTMRGHESYVLSVAFSPNGRRIVSGSGERFNSGGDDNTIKVWDAEKGGQALLTLRGHEEIVISVAFSPDGKRIASGSRGETIKVWDAEKGSEALLTMRGHEDDVNSVAFSADGRRIVSGSDDKTIKVWDAEKGGQALLTLRGHEDLVLSVGFSPDGRRIVSGSRNDRSVTVYPDGRRIVSESHEMTIKVWDAEKGGQALLTLRNVDDVNSVAFSPDGRRIVSGSRDNTIKVWDAEKGGEAILTMRGHEDDVKSVAFSADGKRIVSGSDDKTIKVWDAEKGGQALLTLRGHADEVNSVAFSPDGRRIVSGSSDKTIKVWDAEKGGQALLTMRGHEDDVYSVAFSPDGRRIVSGSFDKTIKVWDTGHADAYGYASLSMLAGLGRVGYVRSLLEGGADVNAADRDGNTPLYRASQKGRIEVVKLLLEAGADVDTAQKDGRNPLIKASSYGVSKVVKLLLEAGADVDAADAEGLTSLDWALENGFSASVKVLLEAGAKVDASASRAIVKIYEREGRFADAMADCEKAVRLNPKNAHAYLVIAWIQATCMEAKFRDGTKAVENATKACELTDWKNWVCLETLAASYAEAGDFESAMKWQKEAEILFDRADKVIDNIGDNNFAFWKPIYKHRSKLYQSGHPYHEKPVVRGVQGTITVDKSTYAPGENIVANFSDGPGNSKDWIGIYDSGVIPRTPLFSGYQTGPHNWIYVGGSKKGNVTLDGSTVQIDWPLPAGKYNVYFHCCGVYEVIAGPVPITIATDDGNRNENDEGNGDEGAGVIPEESQGEN